MNMHKYEKIWLYFGTLTLLIFLIVVGVSAFYMGNQPPSCAVTLNPANVDKTAPFDDPGLREIGENEYQLTIVASAFNYDVGADDKGVEICKGPTVHMTASTKDIAQRYDNSSLSWVRNRWYKHKYDA